MSDKPLYDAHCHLLNGSYLADELQEIFRKHFFDRMEKHPDLQDEYRVKGDLHSGDDDFSDKFLMFFHWLSELLANLHGTPESSMRMLTKAAGEAWGADPEEIRLIPLSMDISYMLDKPLLPSGTNDGDDAIHRLGKMIDKCDRGHGSTDQHRTATATLNRHYRNTLAQNKRPGLFKCRPTGFENEIAALQEIVKHKNLDGRKIVTPFLAIDPRRPGILAKMRKLVNPKKGPFFGVKLYPRLGVHPQCKELEPVYKFCERKNIPITTHASIGGFPFSDWVYEEWGDPIHFEKVLEKHPKLRINFAHFGHYAVGDSCDFRWADAIAGIMKKGYDAYTDLSCYTTENDIMTFNKTVWSKYHDLAKNRTMFGTDFDILYIANPGDIDLKKYFYLFSEFISPDDLDRMRTNNPASFLNADRRN